MDQVNSSVTDSQVSKLSKVGALLNKFTRLETLYFSAISKASSLEDQLQHVQTCLSNKEAENQQLQSTNEKLADAFHRLNQTINHETSLAKQKQKKQQATKMQALELENHRETIQLLTRERNELQSKVSKLESVTAQNDKLQRQLEKLQSVVKQLKLENEELSCQINQSIIDRSSSRTKKRRNNAAKSARDS